MYNLMYNDGNNNENVVKSYKFEIEALHEAFISNSNEVLHNRKGFYYVATE